MRHFVFILEIDGMAIWKNGSMNNFIPFGTVKPRSRSIMVKDFHLFFPSCFFCKKIESVSIVSL